MRRQNESSVVFALSAICIVGLFSLLCFNEGLTFVGDNIFLHNRLVQIRDCFRHGLYPFLYYEDAGGIGYGTPIFYGQLTLFPFIPFADDISVFMRLYFLCCLLLNFFGFRCFLTRLSENATLVSCFYITSMAFFGLCGGNIPANIMGVGWSWLFFAYCIDYFRDGRGFVPLILTYFMIWQSNFNAVVLATIVCFGIFIVYFRSDRLLSYVKLLFGVLAVVGFDIVNMAVHADAIHTVSPADMLSLFEANGDVRVMSVLPLGGYVFHNILDGVDRKTAFMTFGVFAVFVYYVCRYIWRESLRFRVCSAVILSLTAVGYVVGLYPVWAVVYQATGAFFQFPIRYYVLLFGFVLAILSRVIRPNALVYLAVLLCVVDVFLANPFSSDVSDPSDIVLYQIGNGEYASDSFVRSESVYLTYSSSVQSRSGAYYSFGREYGTVTVDCSSNPGVDIITLPKLYYYGYQAVGANGKRFSVHSGFSNYCEIDIGGYTGTLTLSYRVPVWPMALFVLQIVSVCCLLFIIIRRRLVRRESVS